MTAERMAGEQLCLASASPRRRALLEGLGLRLRVQPAAIAEVGREGEPPAAFAARMASEKARAVRALLDRAGDASLPVLAADTCVVIDGLVLGKPRDRGHCLEMLGRLSGRTHEVVTAVAVAAGDALHEAASTTRVSFRQLDEARMGRYWATGEPEDKAGGYAIQGLGAGFVTRLEGSYTAVVGLPLYECTLLLERVGVRWL